MKETIERLAYLIDDLYVTGRVTWEEWLEMDGLMVQLLKGDNNA